jgi:hypothetical protein
MAPPPRGGGLGCLYARARPQLLTKLGRQRGGVKRDPDVASLDANYAALAKMWGDAGAQKNNTVLSGRTWKALSNVYLPFAPVVRCLCVAGVCSQDAATGRPNSACDTPACETLVRRPTAPAAAQFMDQNEYALAQGFSDDASCAWPFEIDALLKLAVKADAYLTIAEVCRTHFVLAHRPAMFCATKARLTLLAGARSHVQGAARARRLVVLAAHWPRRHSAAR